MLTFMADYDVIVCPAMPTPAKPHHHGLVEVNDFSRLVVHNITRWPGAVVRCGTSRDGLPIGVQIVARPWQDATALAVAASPLVFVQRVGDRREWKCVSKHSVSSIVVV
jgi:amidase